MNCRFESRDWRSLDQSKFQKNNRTAPTNCWLLAFAGSDKITWSSELFAFSATFREQPWNNELPTRIVWLAFVGSIRKNQNIQKLELSAYDATFKNQLPTFALNGRNQATKLDQWIADGLSFIGSFKIKQNNQSSELFAYDARFRNYCRCLRQGSQSGTASNNNELPTQIVWLAFVESIRLTKPDQILK